MIIVRIDLNFTVGAFALLVGILTDAFHITTIPTPPQEIMIVDNKRFQFVPPPTQVQKFQAWKKEVK